MVERSRVYVQVLGGSREGAANTAIPGTFTVFSPNRIRGVHILADVLKILIWSSITNALQVDN